MVLSRAVLCDPGKRACHLFVFFGSVARQSQRTTFYFEQIRVFQAGRSRAVNT